MRPMNSTQWLRHFQGNRLDRPEPHWHLPCREEPRTRVELARSLSHFQLGESGQGSVLLATAGATHPHDPYWVEALALFIAEEQEHARLLEGLVHRFHGELTSRHWTHACFRLLRRALGVQFEIQVLVTAELIGTAYYGLLHSHTHDVVLEQVCALVLRDEAFHVAFHADRVTDWQQRWPPLRRGLWVAQFRAGYAGAAALAWVDHRRALTALGIKWRGFLAETQRQSSAFLRSIRGPVPTARCCAMEPSSGWPGDVRPSGPGHPRPGG